jgi:outer membrane protein
VQLASLKHDFQAKQIPRQNLTTWFSLASANNLDLTSNELSSQQAYYNYQAKDVGLYPKATISLAQAYNSLSSDTTTLSITLSGTLYDGGLNRAQTLEAQENWHASQQQGVALVRSTQQQVRRWHQTLDTNRQQIQAFASLLQSVKASLAGKKQEYKLGLRDISDMLDAEKLVFAAQRNLATARLDLVLNHLRLKQVSGLLNNDDLVQLDQWFN